MKKIFTSIVLMSFLVAGCGDPSYSWPQEIAILTPTTGFDGTPWMVEADKMTGEKDQLYIGEAGDRQGYRKGEILQLEGKAYIVDSITEDRTTGKVMVILKGQK